MSVIDLRINKDFPFNTRTIFQQTSAPLGWVKDTSSSINNSALRIVNGSVSTGGINGFTNVMNSTVTTTGGGVHSHALSINEMPSHDHFGFNHGHSVSFGNTEFDRNWFFLGRWYEVYMSGGSNPRNLNNYSSTGMSFNGSSWGHAHGFTNPNFNLNLKYIDFIVCIKQ